HEVARDLREGGKVSARSRLREFVNFIFDVLCDVFLHERRGDAPLCKGGKLLYFEPHARRVARTVGNEQFRSVRIDRNALTAHEAEQPAREHLLALSAAVDEGDARLLLQIRRARLLARVDKKEHRRRAWSFAVRLEKVLPIALSGV